MKTFITCVCLLTAAALIFASNPNPEHGQVGRWAVTAVNLPIVNGNTVVRIDTMTGQADYAAIVQLKESSHLVWRSILDNAGLYKMAEILANPNIPVAPAPPRSGQ